MLKKSIFIILLSGIYMTCLTAQDAGEIVKFDQKIIHLGAVKKGEKVTSQYRFKNISPDTVKIDLVSTCECTESKWTVGPIAPGEQGKIDFVFDSNAKEKEEPIDVDVYFQNISPTTGNPYSIYLQYTFNFVD